MPDAKMLGENIKNLRKHRGMTQAAFAEEMNVSFQAVSNWERGIAPPDLDNLIRIASYFGVTVDDLLFRKREELYLGIDGGGTKTEFALVSSQGYVLRHFCKEGCNPNDIGYSKMMDILVSGIDGMLVEFASLRSVFLGISGITVGNYIKRALGDLKRRYPQIKFELGSDAQNLFAIDDSVRMAVISGTGSVVFVKVKDGFKRLGGWGHLLDSAGSAFDIGRDALRCALREEDMGVAPSTLSALIRKRLDTPTVWEHIHTIYTEGKPYVASLAEVVFEAYRQGQKNAIDIVDRNARALAELLDAGAEMYSAAPVAIASGGLFEHYGNIMTEHIGKYCGAKLIISDLPPIFGACKRASSLGECDIAEDFYENFKKTYGGKGIR